MLVYAWIWIFLEAFCDSRPESGKRELRRRSAILPISRLLS
ncbi:MULTISPECIES: hypothetical protein [Bradyrhizobium]|nr:MULTISPECIES: hypothetical protein [Bradyrhizobium]